MFLLVFLLCFPASCVSDVYMHNFRGSNNRLMETSATRRNANRLFDSQNNDRGGYNVASATTSTSTRTANQYVESFASGSRMEMVWTNQHGSGPGNDKVESNVVIQAMVQEVGEETAADRLRNGEDGGTQNTNRAERRKGLNEPLANYRSCQNTKRNTGLFTADQLTGNNGNRRRATSTRQNPNGQRRGYECSEERDYWPYWRVSCWHDIAVLFSDVNSARAQNIAGRSQNVQRRGVCYKPGRVNNNNLIPWNAEDCAAEGGEWRMGRTYMYKREAMTTKTTCEANGGVWDFPVDCSMVVGPREECLVPAPPPVVDSLPTVAENYNGFIRQFITLPRVEGRVSMVTRILYNITTGDVTRNLDRSDNNVLDNNQPLQLAPGVQLNQAINTAQHGRTFQDRSHVFSVEPADVPEGTVIHNVVTIGKRGNNGQTYPAIEYNYSPKDLVVKAGEVVAFQTAGSNRHNNGPNGGDGQTGDDGQGRRNTDRSNFVMWDQSGATPMPAPNGGSFFNERVEVLGPNPGLNLARDMATMGAGTRVNRLLNDAPASYKAPLFRIKDPGGVGSLVTAGGGSTAGRSRTRTRRGRRRRTKRSTAPATFVYGCTRNNNFSNRDQQGTITIV